MFIDSHIHLDAPEFDADRDAVIAAAREAGVTRFIVPAVGRGNFDTVARLVAGLPGSACAFGIHPLFVDAAAEEDLAALREALGRGVACAVGEIGLDGFEDEPDAARREHFFAEQLKLAREFDLPVILHVRRAQDRVLKYLRRHRVRGGIAHAFNGSAQQARAFLDLGFHLGFGGAMTYSGSTRIRALAAQVPLERIVLETDAPDIPPAWAAGGRNVPANLPRFAQELADLRGIPVEEVRAACHAATRQALHLADER
ncbi:MAG: TatD family hydrolase [Candidatus Dactylopiibacterium sp.]|nr:TatD family hydrolase [Candidatus Dactylopiibacterium sp.]